MTDEDYLGYLLDLTDPDERVAVAAHLAAHPDAAAHVARLRAALAPLAAERDEVAPPAGLAARTVARLAAYLVEHDPRPPAALTSPEAIARDVAPHLAAPARPVESTDRPEPRAVGGRFRGELVVAAGIGLLAVGLAFSFVGRARHEADVLACQKNLMTLHQGLTGYADVRGGRFPQVWV